METGLHPMNYLAGVSETTSEILTTMAQRWKHYDEDGRLLF